MSVINSISKNVSAGKKSRSLNSGGEFGFYLVNDTILLLVLLVVAYPIIFVISASFSSPQAVVSGRVMLWPVDLSIEGYKAILREQRVLIGYRNTILYTVGGTALNLLMTIICAYPLSRKDFVGRNIFMFIFTFTMLFSGGLLPSYLINQRLGLINTWPVMIIPGAIGVYQVIIARTFYQSNISDELLEAAFLDGCDNINFVIRVVLPLSKAITAVLVLQYAIGHWNQYFNALIYLSNRDLLPLQIFLREILILNQLTSDMFYDPELAAVRQGLSDLLKYSLIVASTLPVWCAYPFVQKYFIKGIMIGSIKG